MFFRHEDRLAIGGNLEAIEMVDMLVERDEESLPAFDLPHEEHVACTGDNPLVLKTLETMV
jgi:hypothetical protein